MQLDFTTIAPAEAYRWLASTVTPRPIAWVSTLSAEGASNLAPFSFFQVISDEPPTLMVNVSLRDDGSLKDTLRNVQATGQLVIHLVGAAQAETMNATSAWLPHGVSEIETVGIPTVSSVRVAPPRIAAAAVAFECEVAEIKPYPAENP
ncbi:TPA: flavin reductase family protein, partial [Pseudomonas aeruginosa]|nr:flavin reductase family protein [Pseudomonas aeruginosa]